jgi:hypothetical protein
MAIVVECPECGTTFAPLAGAVLAGSGWMICPSCFAGGTTDRITRAGARGLGTFVEGSESKSAPRPRVPLAPRGGQDRRGRPSPTGDNAGCMAEA